MAFSNWLCANNTKAMFVKVVHPGGHVELHDRPVLAAEIMLRNPRHCVAHPHVFQQPWAILSPDTTLMPGQKFYVVPISTIRKLQKLSFKYSPSPVQEMETKHTHNHKGGEEEGSSSCWFFVNRKKKANSSDDNCFACLLTVIHVKGSTEASSEETRSSSSAGSSETIGLTRKRAKDAVGKGGSPRRSLSSDSWQPRLERICEE
ncbi:hypothetical protein Acr_16g0006620 [Actinidia rufa]|uniref:Uncharacterized protein n=1 Tax=Actinidia rufa TaxID=165716 RepID=A0A7J0G0Z3_9ERIC|nr:hypothetical protein Acr_16g0006620 [Actinidia rufa]